MSISVLHDELTVLFISPRLLIPSDPLKYNMRLATANERSVRNSYKT